MFKWIALGLIALIVAILGYRYAVMDDTNARVAAEIRQNPDGERAAETMLVTLADGRMYPVNYLREENLVFMGIDGWWWREFTGAGQPITLHIQGEDYVGHAKTVVDDPDYTAECS